MRSQRINFRHVLLLTFVLTTNQSIASGLSYSYVEVGYLDTNLDVDGVDIDGDGYAFVASSDITDNLAVFITYEEEDYQFDIEGKAAQFGINYHTPISATGDLVVSISAADVEISQPLLGTQDDTGNAIRIGLRNQNSKVAEVSIFISRIDVFDDTDTSFALDMGLNATDAMQVVLGFSTSDNGSLLSIGLRAFY